MDTGGRSLILYAFDLDKQPRYHEAKAFQAWGKPESATGKPVSLGNFYEDSEQNRRQVVKSDTPTCWPRSMPCLSPSSPKADGREEAGYVPR